MAFVGRLLSALLLMLASPARADVPVHDAVAIQTSAGSQFACFVTTAGKVKCLGIDYGPTAFLVADFGPGVSSFTLGNGHGCVVTAAGGVQCWGSNTYGQLGNASFGGGSGTPVDVFGLTSGVIAVAAGANHTCAVTTTGTLKCWGRNDRGQLGDGSTMDRAIPVDVTGLGSSMAAVAGGSVHTCAVTNGGGVKCWGNNGLGELGIGTTDPNPVTAPQDVNGLSSGVTAISVGDRHTCVVVSGGAKCWGYNIDGQIGNGSPNPIEPAPVDVTGLSSGVSSVTAGYGGQSCAVLVGGMVKCWGRNDWGQLGDGTQINRPAPVSVIGLATPIVAVDAGALITCALTIDHGIKCWGYNFSGTLDIPVIRPIPVDVAGLGSGVSALTAGYLYTCAIDNGGAKCWGENHSGQLGTNSTSTSLLPVGVAGLGSGVARLSAGGGIYRYHVIATSEGHTCAVTTAGGAKCWGWNQYGQLGDFTQTNRLTPVDVSGFTSGVADIITGGAHTCLITTTGGAKCWGLNDHGQVGNNTTSSPLVPVDVEGLGSGVLALAAGDQHTCALVSGGGVKCWGYGSLLGDNGMGSLTPVDVSGLTSGVTAISAFSSGDFTSSIPFGHTCAIASGGALKCWGTNSDGEVGDGSTNNTIFVPVDVVGLSSGVVGVAVGVSHSCALLVSGAVKCWGANYSGQLGDGSFTQHATPVDVVGLTSGVTAIAAGAAHTCAKLAAGGVKCWGDNHRGQLGNGEAEFIPYPHDVTYGSINRTFVASYGTDGPDCTSNSPCRTFAVALVQTLAGGEIVALDGAGYGPVTIDKSVSIIAPTGTYAGITAFPGQDGIVVAAGSGGRVTLRGLAINGLGGNNGVRFDSGAELSIADTTIAGFSVAGINAQSANASKVSITDSRVSGSAVGVRFAGSAGTGAVIDATALVNNSTGVGGSFDGHLAIRRSQIANNGGVGVSLAALTTTLGVTIDRSVLSGNGDSGVDIGGTHSVDVVVRECVIFDNAFAGVAVGGGFAPSTLRLHKSTVTRNGTGILTAGSGSLYSLGNNTIENNGVDGTPTGTYSAK